jgi:hypothetical protein
MNGRQGRGPGNWDLTSISKLYGFYKAGDNFPVDIGLITLGPGTSMTHNCRAPKQRFVIGTLNTVLAQTGR